jgi:hypothetical protein
MSYAIARNRDVNSDINKLYPEDRAVHEWYRFVLSFPPHLVWQLQPKSSYVKRLWYCAGQEMRSTIALCHQTV